MFRIDIKKTGLEAFFKSYQILVLKEIPKTHTKAVSTRTVWENVNEKLKEDDKSISRASIINFLKDLAKVDLIGSTTATGKGGHRDLYYWDDGGIEGFYKNYAFHVLQTIHGAFPDINLRALVSDVLG